MKRICVNLSTGGTTQQRKDHSTEVSYEDAQAKIQSIRVKYQKANFKEMNEETIIATLEAYR